MQTAELKDQLRELQQWKKENAPLIDKLTQRVFELEEENLNLESRQSEIQSELDQIESSTSDLHCQLASLEQQNKLLKTISQDQNVQIQELQLVKKKLDLKLIDKNCSIEAQLKRIDHLELQKQPKEPTKSVQIRNRSSQTCTISPGPIINGDKIAMEITNQPSSHFTNQSSQTENCNSLQVS